MPNVAIGLAVHIRRQPIKLLLPLWIFTASCLAVCGGQSYSFSIIAQSNQQAGSSGFIFRSFKKNPSINDNGKVTFIGVFDQGEGVFLADANGGLQFISSSGDVAPHKSFGSVWLNNHDQIATTFLVSGNPTVDQVRRYPGSLFSAFDKVAEGGAARTIFGSAKYPLDNI